MYNNGWRFGSPRHPLDLFFLFSRLASLLQFVKEDFEYFVEPEHADHFKCDTG